MNKEKIMQFLDDTAKYASKKYPSSETSMHAFASASRMRELAEEKNTAEECVLQLLSENLLSEGQSMFLLDVDTKYLS